MVINNKENPQEPQDPSIGVEDLLLHNEETRRDVQNLKETEIVQRSENHQEAQTIREASLEALSEIKGSIDSIDTSKEKDKNEVQKIEIVTKEDKEDGNELATAFFKMLKGRKGEQGEKGDFAKGIDGKTPVKGVDYYTEKEIEKIAKDVLALVTISKNNKDAIDYTKIAKDVLSEMSKDKTNKSLTSKDVVRIVASLKGKDKISYNDLKETPTIFKQKGGIAGAGYLKDLSDVSISGLTNGEVLKWNSTTNKFENGAGSGGVSTFIALTDVFETTYVGETGNSVRVNAAETGLEFYTPAGGTDEKVGIDSGATAGYIGAGAGDGVLRVDSTLDYVDGGDYVTVGLDSTLKSNYDAGYSHISNNGSDHSYIDQSVVSGATPTFTNTNFTASTDKNYVTDAELVVIGNTSGTNTGDQSLAGLVTTDQSTPQTIGVTGDRLTKLWAVDITVTNAIAGDITGNAATVTTITGLAPDTATTQATQPNITSAVLLPWTGLKPGVDGEIPTFDASGDPAFVAVGTADQVLTSNGVGAAPTFQDATGGASQLSELSDVVSATNTDKFALMANGSTGYVGRALVEADISDLGTYAATDQTFYIGTTQLAINRASAALTLAGLTLTTPNIGTPSAGTLTSCTGLPLTGLVDDTTTALGVGTLELGHASDTTLSRSAAGILAVEGVVIPSISSTNTLTNKRITARVATFSSDATPDVDTDDYDAVTITAQAAAITDMNFTGTPTNFQKITVRIKDNGTARAITWGSDFEAKGIALPVTTVISKVLTVGFIYDTVTSKWGCVATTQEV